MKLPVLDLIPSPKASPRSSKLAITPKINITSYTPFAGISQSDNVPIKLTSIMDQFYDKQESQQAPTKLEHTPVATQKQKKKVHSSDKAVILSRTAQCNDKHVTELDLEHLVRYMDDE